MLYMMPEDQANLRNAMRQRSLLDEFLGEAAARSKRAWFQENVAAYLSVCDLFGETAIKHHNNLVTRFIERPSVALEQDKLAQVTASGPPLPVLLNALEVLRDLRSAADRAEIGSRYKDIARLRSLIG